MPRITESAIEQLALEKLEALGYRYVYGPAIAVDGEQPERDNYQQVILPGRVKEAIRRINPHAPAVTIEQAFNTIARAGNPDLISSNEAIHNHITNGIEVTYNSKDGERGDKLWLIDFNNIENNEFVVCNQFTVIESNVNKRPDIILFINGLPLVVLELKNPADENATLKKAHTQLTNYYTAIPSLFHYNSFVVASDGIEAKAGTISAAFSRFMAWKTTDGKQEASHLTSQLLTIIDGMLNKATLLELLRHFIVFEKTVHTPLSLGRGIGGEAKITTIETVKKLAAYHQYYAVKKAIISTIRSAGFALPPLEGDGGRSGNQRAGVIWHTQGSGKSLSMVFYTGQLVLSLNNPTIVVITDRNDLDEQLFDTFAASSQLLRQVPVKGDSREELQRLLKVAAGGIIFATIQKFFPEEQQDKYPELSDRKNIVVIADEAHRTQYGFEAKTKYLKDEAGIETGTKISYGFAKHLRDALPHATFIGFTGTR